MKKLSLLVIVLTYPTSQEPTWALSEIKRSVKASK